MSDKLHYFGMEAIGGTLTYIHRKDQNKSVALGNNNSTQIATIALLPLTTHPRLWAERKPKCTIAWSLTQES